VIRYAHNTVLVGMSAAVEARAQRLPPSLGRARRFVAFWRTFAAWRMPVLRVQADTKSFDRPAFDVVVGNGQFAGGLRLSPHSFPGDGMLDVLVFAGPRSDAVTMLPRIFRSGDHLPDPHIRELRARISVRVDADRPLTVVADGAPLGTTPATIQVLPRRLLLKL
jgi:diacylglycerol kinase family enzyme